MSILVYSLRILCILFINTMIPNSLIFSADDFGKSEKANENILRLAEMDKIQRVSIITNGKISKTEAKALLNSKTKLDVHLILPGTDYKNEQGGVLVRSFLFIFNLVTGKISPSKVEKSWKEQIEKFKEIFGKYPDGINSHEHVHFFPPYFKIILKLSRKYKTSYIRFASKKIVSSNNKIGWILNLLNSTNKRYFSMFHVPCSMYLVSLDWIRDFGLFLKNTPDGTIEVVCHPERGEEFEEIMNKVK